MKLNETLQVSTIDWDWYEYRARHMSDQELHYAALDALRAAQANSINEGLYMDEISVYRREQHARSKARKHATFCATEDCNQVVYDRGEERCRSCRFYDATS